MTNRQKIKKLQEQVSIIEFMMKNPAKYKVGENVDGDENPELL